MKEFPWTKMYPAGIPPEVALYEHQSLIALFEAVFQTYGERIAFENMGTQLSYGALDELSTHFAAYLQEGLGLKKGERIAIQMPNLLQFPVALIGALKAGLIVVNTNPLYTPREMEHQFRDSGASAIVIVSNFAFNLQKILGNTGIRHVIMTDLGDMLKGIKRPLVNFVVKRIKKMVPPYHIPGAIPFREALSKGAGMKLTRPDFSLEDPAVLQYTGGTTGISKGAVLSHANIIAHNTMVKHWFRPYLASGSGQEIVITAIPMYHIFALTVNGVLMMSVGAKNILITNPRDMKGFVRELRKHEFTLMTGVNTLFNGLLHNDGFKDVDFSHLKGAVGGGMAVQDAVAIRWEEVTGKPLVEGYGLSETSPVLCCNPLDGTHKRGTIGLPMPSTEVAIFDDAGNQVPQGQTGEICAKGPQVMSGYWKQDNLEVFYPEGWFKTGDIGYMDEQGFFKIVDRKKDMIKVSGFNVFPNEIENVVANHKKVLEVAAIGVPHEKSGEAIKIFVIKKDASLTEDELREFCHENLTKYKVPRYIEFRDTLPKSNVGKILRRALKEEEVKPAA
jgi:long-chain acyl-CoA synthetase